MQIHDEGQFLPGLRGGHLDGSRPGVVSLLAPALYDRDCRGGAGGSRVGDGRAGGAWGRGVVMGWEFKLGQGCRVI